MENNTVLLKIFLSEQKLYEDKPFYEEIVSQAHKQGLIGVSVFKGIMGFGKKHHLHTSKLLDLSENLPITIEIIDNKEKITSFINYLKNIDSELVFIILGA